MLGWLYFSSEWIIRLIMVPVVIRMHRPTASLAWLMIIFFQPWVGLFFYLLIGGNGIGRRRGRRHARMVRTFQNVDRMALRRPRVHHPHIDPATAPLVRLTRRLGGLPIVGGNHVELMSENQHFNERLLDDIANARDHVHLEFYIFEDDSTGRRVAEALAAAVQRGVACRVLADAVGARPMFRRLAPWMIERGIEVHPMLRVNPLRRKLARLDLRNHRKIAIIDGQAAYTGSQNIVDDDYGSKGIVWHDMSVRLTGPAVLQLQLVFMEDWFFETQQILEAPDVLPTPKITGNVPIQTVPSGPMFSTEAFGHVIVEMLNRSKERVIITTPYLVPDEAFLVAMDLAILRGVRIDLVVPETGDHQIVAAAGRAYYGNLLEMGVHIYLHQQGLLHAKTMSVDESFAMIGSANFDIRSFRLNFEINLLMFGPEVARQLRQEQTKYIQQSREIDETSWSNRSRTIEFVDNFAKLLSPLL